MSLDYRSFGDSNTNTQPDRKWWTLKDEEAANSITATLRYLRDAQSARLIQQNRFAQLYGNFGILGMRGGTFSLPKDRIAYNVIQSSIDTVTSKIAKNKPKPYFLTSGGDHIAQQKAKKLNQFAEGVLYENQAYKLGPEIFRDGAVWGDGIIHVFAKNNRVRWERVLSSELWVDEWEGQYGQPRQLHRVKSVDRGLLADLYPSHRRQIEEAKSSNLEDAGFRSNIADMVQVRESWHLPSGPDATDGKCLITVDGHALTPIRPWKHDFFPFARFRWSPRLSGYWSQGCAEQLTPIQVEMNKLLIVIQKSFHLAGSFKVFLENGSKIVKEHLNNDVGAIINYTGSPPQYVTPPIVQPEYFQHFNTLKNAAFEVAGVSMLSAVSQKPAGLNSKVALREFEDIESDRFRTVGQEYDGLFLDAVKLSIACTKDIAAENGNRYSVSVPSKRFLQTIDWKNINLEEDEYVMQCFPVSSLPNDPAGRLETVQEYAQAGFMQPEQARELLNFPDLEAVDSLQRAAEEYLTQILDKMVSDDEPLETAYTAPEPFDNLSRARALALQYYQRGKSQNLDEERLDLLRQFIAQIDEFMNMATPPAPGPAGPPSAQPQAQPMAQPTSDLVQNVPGPTLQ